MRIDQKTVVSMAYQLFTVDPEEPQKTILIEERGSEDPLEFIYGLGVVLSKVEDALMGQAKGYEASVQVPPQEAFGVYRDDLRVWMDRGKFPKDTDLQLGMKFQTQGPNEKVISVIVKEINEKQILVDGNHPLAGLGLKFEVQILRVREATEDEMTQKQILTVLH